MQIRCLILRVLEAPRLGAFTKSNTMPTGKFTQVNEVGRESMRTFEDKRRVTRRDKGKTLKEIYGGIAQLGEHLLCKQGVSGSIPLISTIRLKNKSQKTNMGL